MVWDGETCYSCGGPRRKCNGTYVKKFTDHGDYCYCSVCGDPSGLHNEGQSCRAMFCSKCD